MIAFYNQNALYIYLLLIVVYIVSSSVKNYESYFSKEMLDKIIVGKNTQHKNLLFLILSFIFLVLALARPVIENKPIKIKQSNVGIVCGFDISKSMTATDIYPNRLEFAKNKFYKLLDNLHDEKVAVVGFTSMAYLISPLTNDFSSLKYLVKHINSANISAKGSDILEVIKSANVLLKNRKNKILVIFTDGTSNSDFTQSIEYAKQNGIKVFIYAIGTIKGATIPNGNGVLKDQDGNIVVTLLNETIKQLALQSGGGYLRYSTSNDMQKFIMAIRSSIKAEQSKKDEVINTNEELYYIPLILAFLFFMIATSTFRKDGRW